MKLPLNLPKTPPPTTTRPTGPLQGQSAAVLSEKLQTAEGQALVDALVKDIAPFTKDVGTFDLIERRLAKTAGPKDKFEAAVVDHLYDRYANTQEIRSNAQAAVLQKLLQLSQGGVVTVDAVQKALGPKGVQFFNALNGIGGKSGDPLADRRLVEGMTSEGAKQLASLESIAPKMAALETMMAQVAKPDEFKDFKFMGLQHLFATSATLFGALNKLGIAHDDMHLIGKVYSTNYRVAAELEARGATVNAVSRKTGAKEFAQAMEEAIEDQLRRLISTLPQSNYYVDGKPTWPDGQKPQVLLIDDGAEAIKILHEKFPEYAPFFVCVEQTRRGARILHELEKEGKLLCPVANVAETWAKLEWESPMIGHSVVLEVTRKLDRLEKAGVTVKDEALVVGCGAVGGGVARAMMARGMEVHLYDADPKRANALQQQLLVEATKNGWDASKIFVHRKKEEALAHAGVLVSCVGARTLEAEDHKFLPNGAVLVNAASADDELGPQDLLRGRKDNLEFDGRGDLWSTFQGKPINTGKGNAEAHSDAVVLAEGGKEFYVVNNGYVVNMTGERDPIPARYIQLTRTLLALGAITAKRAIDDKDDPKKGVGVHDVPLEWQEAVVHLVQRELKKTDEDLKNPTWHKKKADQWAPEETPLPPPDVVAAAALEAKNGPKLRDFMNPALVADWQKQAEAVAKLLVETPIVPFDGHKLYGYVIGPAERGTRDRAVAELCDGSTTLSIEGAALHRATLSINTLLGVSLRASLVAPGGQKSPLFTDKAKVQFHEGRVIVEGGGPQSAAHRFEELFGNFARQLLTSLLTNRLKRPPEPHELAGELKALFNKQNIDVSQWTNALYRSTDPDDVALRAALETVAVGPHKTLITPTRY